jgi:predicted kinase
MLTLMVGISGSGKSFLAPEVARTEGVETIVLSSDKFRRIIGGDESNQECSHIVFKNMQNFTQYLLEEGYGVVIDATNYHKKARKDFIKIARFLKVRVRAVVVETSVKTAKERNLSRTRKVPEDVIDRQYNNFEMPDTTEVDEVEVIDND